MVDPSGRFADHTHIIRNGLTSSVDLFNMLVSIGYRGTNDWMRQGHLAAIYGGRHDMVSMLKSPSAPGRPYVLFATDEIVFEYLNFNKAPFHVLGLRLEDCKLGAYVHWRPFTSEIVGTVQQEFYDYSTMRGQLELDNDPNHPRVNKLYQYLIHNLIPNELQQRLPGKLGLQQRFSKEAELLWAAFIALQQPGDLRSGALQKLARFRLGILAGGCKRPAWAPPLRRSSSMFSPSPSISDRAAISVRNRLEFILQFPGKPLGTQPRGRELRASILSGAIRETATLGPDPTPDVRYGGRYRELRRSPPRSDHQNIIVRPDGSFVHPCAPVKARLHARQLCPKHGSELHPQKRARPTAQRGHARPGRG